MTGDKREGNACVPGQMKEDVKGREAALSVLRALS